MWTYSGDPTTRPTDAVRFYVQDTNTNEQLVTDEEISFALSEVDSNVRRAASLISEVIARGFAMQATISDSGFRVELHARAQMYWTLAKELKDDSGLIVTPFIGGISIDDKQGYEDDDDRVDPAFTRDQFSPPGTVDTDERLSSS